MYAVFRAWPCSIQDSSWEHRIQTWDMTFMFKYLKKKVVSTLEKRKEKSRRSVCGGEGVKRQNAYALFIWTHFKKWSHLIVEKSTIQAELFRVTVLTCQTHARELVRVEAGWGLNHVTLHNLFFFGEKTPAEMKTDDGYTWTFCICMQGNTSPHHKGVVLLISVGAVLYASSFPLPARLLPCSPSVFYFTWHGATILTEGSKQQDHSATSKLCRVMSVTLLFKKKIFFKWKHQYNHTGSVLES